MFELLCVISMALCKVLVLVNMGIFYFFFFSFHSQPSYPWGSFRSCFKTDISRFIPSLSSDKKPRSSPSMWRSPFWSLLDERVEKVFQPKVDKAAVAGSSRGHISAARTDPSTPDPPDRQHFSPRRCSLCFGGLFHPQKKRKRKKAKADSK